MYFSLSLPLLPGRLPVLPELPGQQIRDMQVVRSPPSEPTNGRPRSLHRHLGLRDGRWSHRFHWCHWCHRCRATASTAVRFCRLCPLFPSQPPFPLQALKCYHGHFEGFPPWPWPLSQPLRPNAVLATRLNNSSVHKPRSHPPLPTWRSRRRQATPHSTGGCTPAQGAPQWAPPYSPAPTPTVAWSSDAPSSSQKQTHFVSLGLHIRQSGLASDHLDHAARVFVVLDAYQVCP